jgi:hypothetical protein
VPPGSTSATFSVGTTAVAANATATITASGNGASASGTLTINAAVLVSLTFNPSTVVGGQTTSLTAAVSGPAPAGGAVVKLTTSIPTGGLVPVSITIPAGATSASINITSAVVKSNYSITVTGTCNGTSKSATMTVIP